jgi:photosystem II stability/assembly factor-like uncharacterized protein
MKPTILLILHLFCALTLSAQQIVSLHAGTDTSIRGLSVVNDSVAWVSGSKGWTAYTTDAGKTWHWKQLADYALLDFRDIEAFSDRHAIMVSAGSPAIIVVTDDGGKSWKEVYRNDSPDIFLDGMDFWDTQRGIIYGDPINGQMQLMETKDGGKTWQSIAANLKEKLKTGEASFAASGTGIRTRKGGHVWIATGGTVSRIFYSSDYGKSWKFFDCPVIQGKNSTGTFSVAFADSKMGIAVGGDYQADTLRTNNLFLTFDGGRTWKPPVGNPFGFRSAVEYLDRDRVIATGTSGTDLSIDGGKTWKPITTEGYHTVRKAKHGKWVVLTGSKGRIATLDE